MKKSALLTATLSLFLILTVLTSPVIGGTLFGPKQYVRTNGAPDVFTDTFSASPGAATLTVRNGHWDGARKIKDAVSSALVVLNSTEIFGPEDFKKKVHLLEASVDLAENNTIQVELRSKPGTYITVEVLQEGLPPTVTISADPEEIRAGESSTLQWDSTDAESATIDQGIGDVPVSGTIAVSPTTTTIYTITVTNTAGTDTAQAVVTVTPAVELQPEGSFGERYEDLIPQNATVEQYDPKRFSLITGLVHGANALPLSNVSISIYGHSEYGDVLTDINGRFSIPVEGGSTMTVVYKKSGLITVHRKVEVPWNEIAIAETIQMIPEDQLSTVVTFDGNPSAIFTHQSTLITDESGSRSCTVVLAGDNQAYAIDPQGNILQELDTISVRATEFPTPDSMPAKLPPNSAYTYCVELSVDGVERVLFNKPVVTWVDNFLGFAVGEPVPVGYYDREKVMSDCTGDSLGAWVPSENGIVVKLLDTDLDGVVDALDADGDDLADDLDLDGSVSDEVTGLGDPARYAPGSTFWRVEVTHFTSDDFNWPWKYPDDGAYPEGWPLGDEQGPDSCPVTTSSFTEPRSRIFHEEIPVPGTDITLHYASNRVAGYKTVITVPASGDTVPASLKRIVVKVEIAGQTLEQTLAAQPNQIAEFTWDGLDHLGRPVTGATTATVRVGYVYDAVYMSAADVERAFGLPGGSLTGIPARQEVIRWKRTPLLVSGRSSVIAEGWTLSTHHHLDTVGKHTLTKGDGSLISKQTDTIETVAGDGGWIYGGDGGPATQAQISDAYGVALDAAGNLYISDTYNYRIRKVDTNGIITTIAGDGASGFSGDGGSATYARLDLPWGIAVDAAGNVYFADSRNHRIRKVDACGIITTVAGSGPTGYGNDAYSGDGGPATQARLAYPTDVFADSIGNLFIADAYNHCIRKVDSSGTITTVAGTGTPGMSGDGGPATSAQLEEPFSITMDVAGNLYIADSMNERIRKVDTSGIITTIAGDGNWGYGGDGGPATGAQLYDPRGLSLDAAGNLYISDAWNMRIRKVDTSGIITTVAGTGIEGYDGDGGAATQSQLYFPADVAVDAAGNLYLADAWNYRIRRVQVFSISAAATGGETLFAEEGGTGHIFSSAGRHLSTIDLDTGVVLREFDYDGNNRLVSITDRFGNQTTIQRAGNGVPTSITSPDGLTTNLTVNASNFLTAITYPDGSTYGFEYSAGGLLTAKIEPESNRFEHVFDLNGRLTDATDEEGGHWQFLRQVNEDSEILTQVTTGEGNVTSYLDYTDSTGAYASTVTDPTGAQTRFFRSSDGLNAEKSLPCGMELAFQYDLDPQYKFKYVREVSEGAPSGLQRVILRDRTYQDTDLDSVPDLITATSTVNGKSTTLVNDVLQSQKTVTSPEGRTLTTFYAPATLLTTNLLIPGLYETIYGYNLQGRLTSVVQNTRQTTFSYNALGFLESVTDPELHTTTYDYDDVGRVTAIHRPDTSTIGFDYDLNGNMTVLTNPSLVGHGFGYNNVNLNSSYQTPISGTYSYVYDRDRRLTQINFPSGDQINNIYVNTQLMQVQTPEGNVDYTYLCGTKVGSITNGTDTITYGYDGKLVTSETLSGTLNQSLNYTYNNNFNVDSFTYAGGTQTYAYDNDNLLIGAGGFTIARNAGNGLPEAVADGSLTLSRTFNGYGELSEEDFSVSGLGVASWSVTRDDNGRITNKTETIGGTASSYVYTYDPMGRLRTVTKDSSLVEEYQYDANGTRSYEMNVLRGIPGRSFAYSDEDHLLTAGTATYNYDLDGFLTTKTDGSDMTQYDYSSRGELQSVTLPDGMLIEYVHDPVGRRIAKRVDGVTLEKYLWQGLTRLLAVYDGSDNLIMRFEYADGRLPVAMTTGGATYYLSYDQVGSLRVVADASGNVVKRIDYDSFGNIINDTNPLFDIRFGFAGGLHDRDTGLVRFGFRDYDPDVGRWTAKDPLFFSGADSDLYRYVFNDPINLTDPEGLFCIPIWSKIGEWENVGDPIPKYTYQPTFTDVHGPLGWCIWKKYNVQRQRRSVVARELCCEIKKACPYVKCFIKESDTISFEYMDQERILGVKIVPATGWSTGRSPDEVAQGACRNPWTGEWRAW